MGYDVTNIGNQNKLYLKECFLIFGWLEVILCLQSNMPLLTEAVPFFLTSSLSPSIPFSFTLPLFLSLSLHIYYLRSSLLCLTLCLALNRVALRVALSVALCVDLCVTLCVALRVALCLDLCIYLSSIFF